MADDEELLTPDRPGFSRRRLLALMAAAAGTAAVVDTAGGFGGGTAANAAVAWYFPLTYYAKINSGFGPRTGPGTSPHQGIDYEASAMTPIYAAASGTVIYAQFHDGYGNFVRIDHGGGFESGYAHMTDGTMKVSVGQKVPAGTQLGNVGNTGASFGAHLHFEIRQNGPAIDPAPIISNAPLATGKPVLTKALSDMFAPLVYGLTDANGKLLGYVEQGLTYRKNISYDFAAAAMKAQGGGPIVILNPNDEHVVNSSFTSERAGLTALIKAATA